MAYGKNWTDDELHRMGELLGQGKTYRQIGEDLNRSMMSCKAKMIRCMAESDSLEVTA